MSELPPCRACGERALALVLDLGHTPLANALLDAAQLDAPESTYPLELAFCRACALLQLTVAVPPAILFADYPYFSSVSDTVVRHAEAIAVRLVGDRDLGPGSLVIELASNDGYLLQHYKRRGVPVLGIEPAANVAREAEARHGIPHVVEFFDRKLAARLAAEGRRADVLHAHNVLAHVPDLDGFVAGMATLLAPDGLIVIEVPYAKEMLDHVEYDTIYHEHLCYFALTPLRRLLARHGLAVVDVERLAIHGGSLRVFVAHAAAAGAASGAVEALAAEEAAWQVDRLETYTPFADRVQALKTELVGLLRRLKSEGKRIACYGASAKGSTLLNTCGLGRETLDFVVDRNPIKQGRYTPGTHLPIAAPERLLAEQPDFALLLTWNFADEILAQQAAYRERGGRFVIPIPTVRIA